mmetsp:Transcript_29439/g.53253  ORF Transcript_29439/g.53253 Transcript_29439/m.53253 type:complete len:239 (+) Transcript_29439:736-1452(+)
MTTLLQLQRTITLLQFRAESRMSLPFKMKTKTMIDLLPLRLVLSLVLPVSCFSEYCSLSDARTVERINHHKRQLLHWKRMMMTTHLVVPPLSLRKAALNKLLQEEWHRLTKMRFELKHSRRNVNMQWKRALELSRRTQRTIVTRGAWSWSLPMLPILAPVTHRLTCNHVNHKTANSAEKMVLFSSLEIGNQKRMTLLKRPWPNVLQPVLEIVCIDLLYLVHFDWVHAYPSWRRRGSLV